MCVDGVPEAATLELIRLTKHLLALIHSSVDMSNPAESGRSGELRVVVTDNRGSFVSQNLRPELIHLGQAPLSEEGKGQAVHHGNRRHGTLIVWHCSEDAHQIAGERLSLG
jgi:hypothetical protein